MVLCGLISVLFRKLQSQKDTQTEAGGEEENSKTTCCRPSICEHIWVNILGIVAMVVVWLVAGAFIFRLLEQGAELKLRHETAAAMKTFEMLYPNVKQGDLDRLIGSIVDATQKGVNPSKVSRDANWGFGQSFFFAGTLISTVGYGHVSPLTAGGKAFTILYACIGIPLTLTLLTALVERMKRPSLWFLGRLNQRFGHLWQPMQIRFLHLGLIFCSFALFLFIIPSIFFSSIEKDWSFLDAFYYCFISLTTIGLGDYIPGDRPGQPLRAVYKVVATIYLLVGLCCMMLLLATIYDIPQLNLSNLFLVKDDGSNDQEKLLLANQSGPQYSQHIDEPSPDSPPSSLGPRTPADSYYQISPQK